LLEIFSSPKAAWDAALGELQLQVNRSNYDTWLRNTTGLTFEQGEFVVSVASTFAAEYLEKTQRSLVEKVLSGILRQEVSVHFTVSQPGISATHGLGKKSAVSSQQGCLPLFNPRYTFDSFTTGQCNQLAYAASLAVARDPGGFYNPLFLYGGPGLGKTHLLQAIGHTAVENSMKVLYVSAEQYANDFVASIRERQTHEVVQKYRSVDMLLLEDVQFFSGKQKIGESFFHTFDELQNAGKQIVVSSDRAPGAIPLLPERLRSRLEGGLVTPLDLPDFETRLSILHGKRQQDDVNISNDVLEYLAEQVHQSIRALEGSLNRVIAYARMIKTDVTPQLAARAIRDLGGSKAALPQLSAARIVDVVAQCFQMRPEDLLGKKRDKETSCARRVAMYVMRDQTNLTGTQIGQELGGRDAAAVTNSCKKITSEMASNPFVRRKIIEIQQNILQD
jgi:chromosomal replication initiator protein